MHGSRYVYEGAGGPLRLHRDAFDAARSVALAAQALIAQSPAVQEPGEVRVLVPPGPQA